MKKILLLLMIFVIGANGFAQNKRLSPEERAKESAKYIRKKMDLSKSDYKFIRKTLETKYKEVESYIQLNEDFTPEEKRVIYKESRTWTQKEFESRFPDSQVKQIFMYLREFRKMNKKD